MPQKNTFLSSSLAQSLQTLSAEEFRSLGKWLRSPWCNSNKKLSELYIYLKKYFPHFDTPQLNREAVFNNLYPKKDFNDKWLRNILAAMNKQVERFLIHQRLEREDPLKKIILAKEYERRHQTERLLKLAKAFNDQLAATKHKSWEEYFYLCYLNDLMYYQPEARHLWAAIEHPLAKADHYLDHFYVMGKWRYQSELVERSKQLKEENSGLINLKILKQLSGSLPISSIYFYQEILELGKNISVDYFNQLKEKYLQQMDQFPLQDRKLIFLYLLNILIRMCVRAQSDLYKDLFELYQIGLQNQLIIHNERITDKTFSNIVTLGNSLHRFKEVHHFIQEYTPRLKPMEQPDGHHWAIAHWHFNQGDAEAAIDLLNSHKFDNPLFRSQGRFLLLQAYFEMVQKNDTYISMFFDYSEAYKKMLHREKNYSVDRKKAYLNFIKYTCQLVNILIRKEAQSMELKKLIKTLDQENLIQGKKWLRAVIQKAIPKKK